MPTHTRELSRALLGRLLLYSLLACMGALIFNNSALVLGIYMFGLSLFGVGAFFLACYLPLIDLPWLAWRHTRNVFAAALMILPGLILPLGLPLRYNARIEKTSTRTVLPPPEKPITAQHILVVGERSAGDAGMCGPFCQTLLWSGAVDHVMARPTIKPNEHPDSATLFTVQSGESCPSRSNLPAPREGFCIVGTAIPNPTYDALIEVEESPGDESHLPFRTKLHVEPKHRLAWISDCRKSCTPIADFAWDTGERLALPLMLHWGGGEDYSYNTFGIFLARKPFASKSPEQILRSVFAMDTTAFAPRTGFHGDVTHGGPAAPPSRFEYVQKQNDIAYAKAEKHREEALAEVRANEEKLERYRAKLAAIRASHPDCPTPLTSSGPDPQYLGCDRDTPPAPPSDSFADIQAKLRR